MLKFETWDGKPVEDAIGISFKIDGVQCRRTEDGWVSKSGKKTLYGLDHLLEETSVGEVYEYFNTDWNTSSQLRKHSNVCARHNLYMLYPETDRRLNCILGELFLPNLSSEWIELSLKSALERGYEGLIIKTPTKFIKVKPSETYDVIVRGIYEGKTGKNIGRLGGVITDLGRVGGGWSDEEREDFWRHPEKIIGRTIEVKAMGLTKAGKFRHGNKLRIRWDKE